MTINTCPVHNSNNLDEFQLGFGVEVLDRLDKIRNDMAVFGVPGVLSLLQAVISSGDYLDRDDILRKATFLCHSNMWEAIEDLFDFFKGDDPRRHLWTEDRGFYHSLNKPCPDFSN